MGVDILGVTGVDVRLAGGDLRADFKLFLLFFFELVLNFKRNCISLCFF